MLHGVRGRRHTLPFLFALALLSGCTAPARFTASTRAACFDDAWHTLKHDWAYFEMRDELTDTRARLRGPVVAAETRREYLIALVHMLSWFADPHIQLVNLREYWQAAERQPIGLLVEAVYVAGGHFWVALDPRQIIRVHETHPDALTGASHSAHGSPALDQDGADLPMLPAQALYQLTRVEGVPVSLLALQLLLAESEQSVHLGLRLGNEREIEIEIVRRPHRSLLSPTTQPASQPAREPPPVQSSALPGNIGYIAINSLDDPSVVSRSDAAIDYALNTDGLIIDLRSNSGGQLNIGARVLSRFLTRAQPYAILQARLRWWLPGGDLTTSRSWVRTAAPRGKPYTAPVAVLIDSMTASFGEVLAFALHDTCGALLVGCPTLGAGAGLGDVSLPDGLKFQYSKFPVRRLNGQAYQGAGIQPDILVPLDPAEVEQEGPTAIWRWRQRVLDTAVGALRERIHKPDNH